MGRFDGKVALVTGSTQGVGEALVRRLASEGLAGAVVTGRDRSRGEAVVADLAVLGCDARFVAADLGSVAECQALIEATDEHFGTLHVLANCAARTDRGSIWDSSAELFDSMMAINVRAPFLLIQGAARIMRREGVPGAILNVGSVAGYGGAPFITPYSISKGALMTLTKTVAYQLMSERIRVVHVNPGWIDTPGEDAIQRKYHGAEDGWLAEAEAGRPFGRLIKPDELAATLAFVSSDEAGMMTGSIIDYDQSVQGAGDAPVPPVVP